jgi:uncharacterized protein YbjT (DUF2867 family)
MIVALTGANSFLARALGRALAESGHTLRGTLRQPVQAEQLPWLERFAAASLGEPEIGDLFDGVDAVAHFAHDFTPGAATRNIEGTCALFDQAARAGVTRQLYVSSYSARADAISEYGRTKYSIEALIRDRGGIVVRPGLVLGSGGIYARMVQAMRKFPVLPLPSGEGKIPIISIDQLARALQAILTCHEAPTDAFNLFSPELVTLMQLLKCTRDVTHTRTIFVPVPARPVRIALLLAGKLRFPLPVTADNLDGFIGNQVQIHHANLHLLGIPDESLRQAVELANGVKEE